MSSTDLLHLAWELESRGFAGQEAAVRQVVRSARALGLSRVVVDVLADPDEPEVARLRAFGRVAVQLSAAEPTTPPAVHPAA
jgi:hypothetical protein